MPRWYLHVHDGERAILDPEGSELPDLTAARKEALAAARELLRVRPGIHERRAKRRIRSMAEAA